MDPQSQPPRMTYLCIDAFGKFVYQLMLKLMTMPYNSGTVESSARCLQTVCQYLQDIIKSMVPRTLANEFTAKLLSYVLKIYDELDTRAQVFNAKISPRCQAIAVQVGSSTFHPLTTSFKYYKRSKEENDYLNDTDSFMNLYLQVVLSNAEHVKSLWIMAEPFNNKVILNMPFENLEELYLYYCTDFLIRALSNSNTMLQKLTVNKSERVTDGSVVFILKFKNLKHLDIRSTRISSNGVAKLLLHTSLCLDHIDGTKMDLISFKSHHQLKPRQIRLLPRSFPNLAVIDLQPTKDCSLNPLKSLRHLKSLTLGCYASCETPCLSFSNIKSLLRERGRQLVELKLYEVAETDLKFVNEHCPNLQILGLIFIDIIQLGFAENLDTSSYASMFPLPIFPSVNCLDVKIYNCCVTEYLISRMINAQTVKLWWFPEPNKSLFHRLVHDMIEGKLQQLEIRDMKVQIMDNLVTTTKDDGSSTVVSLEEFETVLKKLCEGLPALPEP